MTAFDGDGLAVSVYFDSDTGEINLSLSDGPEHEVPGLDDVIKIQPDEVEQIVNDLLTACSLRGGDAAQIVRRLATRLDTETPWRDDDLVKLLEANAEMGLGHNRLPKMESLQRRGERTYTPPFPDPVVEGRTARLYSLSELKTWWAAYKA